MSRPSITRVVTVLLPIAMVAGYVAVMGGTRSCPLCMSIVDSTLGLANISTASHVQPEAAPAKADGDGFVLRRRPGSVDLEIEYDTSGALIPIGDVHTLLPRDAIPALSDPKLEPASEGDWLPGEARIIVVEVGDEVVGVPIVILNWHEIVNLKVGGEPVAATYCPLCDSASVFSRRVSTRAGEGEAESVTLEFGVSGALYNSNVLMYDRTDKGLWSQIAMKAVTGPRAGQPLTMLPIRMMPFDEFKAAHQDAMVVSRETGHARDYDWEKRPYQDFFSHDKTLVSVRGMGKALPKKTLGVGVEASGRAWFVPADRLEQGRVTIETPLGPVTVRRTNAGVFVENAPEGVHTAQSFYYAWSAFFPNSEIIGDG